MANSAFQTTIGIFYQNVAQMAHGFSIGNVVRFNGTDYVLALGDTTTDASCVGIVSYINNVNNFALTQVGYIQGLTGLTAGSLHYLSGTVAGALSTTPGAVSVPLLYADSTTSGWYMNSYP
jgi:hypothetical protein